MLTKLLVKKGNYYYLLARLKNIVLSIADDRLGIVATNFRKLFDPLLIIETKVAKRYQYPLNINQ